MTPSAKAENAGGGADRMPTRHKPVMLAEVLAALELAPGQTIIDGTFGAGGYSRAILDALADTRVLALDRDLTAIRAAEPLIASYRGRLDVVHARFSSLESVARAHLTSTPDDGGPQTFSAPDGVVLDIGVSSMQIDTAERGFSFMADGPLDMRMGDAGTSAADFVNAAAEADIADVLYHLGEERRSRAIAKAILRARESTPITTTLGLAAIVEKTLGRARGDEKHPATRTFQALRIHVNDELGELYAALIAAEGILKPGGRLVVVTFHSLEDRIVKRFLARRARPAVAGSRHGPPSPTTQAFAASFQIVNRNPLTSSQGEIAANPRARSAKLRAGVRTDGPALEPEDPAEVGITLGELSETSGKRGRRS